MRVLSIVGARPQFVKLSPVSDALLAAGCEHVVVHTGQHYDANMSDVFFRDLELPAPDVNLGVGSGSHAAQTAAMLVGIEDLLTRRQPHWVLTYGDTNTTLAAALAAAKSGTPVAHLEAGLRSFNRSMPEEVNRVVADHVSDLLLAPTASAVDNLHREGLATRTVLVGDVMLDMTRRMQQHQPQPPAELPQSPFALATVHRQENTDDPGRLLEILDALAALDRPVVLPVHPRLRDRCSDLGWDLHRGSILPMEPLSYRETIATIARASVVITDSGGLQKEAFFLATPCVTLRPETEWEETLEDGWNVLVPDPTTLQAAIARPVPSKPPGHPFGRGDAGRRAVAALQRWEEQRSDAGVGRHGN